MAAGFGRDSCANYFYQRHVHVHVTFYRVRYGLIRVGTWAGGEVTPTCRLKHKAIPDKLIVAHASARWRPSCR